MTAFFRRTAARFRAAWRAFWNVPCDDSDCRASIATATATVTRVESSPELLPPDPYCDIVRARVFGRERTVRLVRRQGASKVVAETPNGPAGIYILDESKIMPEDAARFRRWLAMHDAGTKTA